MNTKVRVTVFSVSRKPMPVSITILLIFILLLSCFRFKSNGKKRKYVKKMYTCICNPYSYRNRGTIVGTSTDESHSVPDFDAERNDTLASTCLMGRQMAPTGESSIHGAGKRLPTSKQLEQVSETGTKALA
jgi:hypothetical protein